MKPRGTRSAFLVLMAIIALPALAKTVYIRDTLYVPLRGGQTPEHRILHRGIQSGTPLELIEANEETGYSLVRMQDGLEGWLQSQYLVDEPIASDLLDDTRERLLELEASHQQTLLRLQDLQAERDRLQSALETARENLSRTEEELEEISRLSANVIQIDEQNEELINEREALEQQINDLISANEVLKDTSAQEWFMRGGAAVIVAILLGFWFARRIYQRRGSGWA